MIIKPKLRGSIALNSHPYGSKKRIENDIDFVTSMDGFSGGKNVLIIGASSGYGLASRIAMTFGGPKANTIGVSFEKKGDIDKVGSAGWYNSIWFNEKAKEFGVISKNFICDAFSTETKDQVVKYIKDELGEKIDLVVYSLASGIRFDPVTGEKYRSTLKPSNSPISGFTFNVEDEDIHKVSIDPASEEDISNTVKVMGGEDWELWIKRLLDEGLLSEGAKSVAYSYIGPEVTKRIYREGTIGAAKEHLEKTALTIDDLLKKEVDGEGLIAVNRAVVTKASAFIPIFPLYASILFNVMEELSLEEDTMAHTFRLFKDMIYGDKRELDSEGRLRPDSWELSDKVQKRVEEIYCKVDENNYKDVIDFSKYIKYFHQLNGFMVDGVDYEKDVDLVEVSKLKP